MIFEKEGTGFFIGPDTILTSAHTVMGASKARIKVASGKTYRGIVRVNPNYTDENADSDFALIKLRKKVAKGFFELSPFPTGESLCLDMAGFPCDRKGLWGQTIVARGTYEDKAFACAFSQPGMSGGPCSYGNTVYGLIKGVMGEHSDDIFIVNGMNVTRVTGFMLTFLVHEMSTFVVKKTLTEQVKNSVLRWVDGRRSC
nr:serine protease [Shimazuella soli]